MDLHSNFTTSCLLLRVTSVYFDAVTLNKLDLRTWDYLSFLDRP